MQRAGASELRATAQSRGGLAMWLVWRLGEKGGQAGGYAGWGRLTSWLVCRNNVSVSRRYVRLRGSLSRHVRATSRAGRGGPTHQSCMRMEKECTHAMSLSSFRTSGIVHKMGMEIKTEVGSWVDFDTDRKQTPNLFQTGDRRGTPWRCLAVPGHGSRMRTDTNTVRRCVVSARGGDNILREVRELITPV